MTPLTIRVYRVDEHGRPYGRRAPVVYLPAPDAAPLMGGYGQCKCKRCKALRAAGRPDLVEQYNLERQGRR